MTPARAGDREHRGPEGRGLAKAPYSTAEPYTGAKIKALGVLEKARYDRNMRRAPIEPCRA